VRFAICCIPLVLSAGCRPESSATDASTITVFAAASTTDVMRDIGTRYEKETGIHLVFSFDSSSNLARQIRAGSPADIFLSADEAWMDELAAAGLLGANSRFDLLANDLVMVAPVSASRFEVEFTPQFDFAARLPQIRRIAVGDTDHVPAGRYAKQALESLGWWKALQPRLIPAKDVRAALRLVEMGEADAGIVYSTDARASDKVTVITRFPEDSHQPIRYPVALCSESDLARQFIDFLRTHEAAAAIFEQAGFHVLSSTKDGGG